jgi:DNA-binding LacI/PurR family transcriptional regulator
VPTTLSGFHVPREIKMAGDDIPIDTMMRPPLAVIHQNYLKFSTLAFSLIARMDVPINQRFLVAFAVKVKLLRSPLW